MIKSIENIDVKIPRVTLEQWRIFDAIVRFGGYAQAAEALNKSQSSLSYMIGCMQEQLGFSVFKLEGRRARLNSAGESLLRYARELLTDALEIEEVAASLKKGWESDIYLAVEAALPYEIMTETLRIFMPQAKTTEVKIAEEVLSGTEEALVQGDADLAITSTVLPGFMGEHLLSLIFVPVAHPEHRLHHLGRSPELEDLMREVQVVVSDSGLRQPRDSGVFGTTHRLTLTTGEAKLAMIRAGIGFGWLPLHSVVNDFESGTLKVIELIEGRQREVPLYLVLGKSRFAGPATLLLAECIRNAVKKVSLEGIRIIKSI
ncbi:MAG: LysR family transcriptional regulator [Pseudomonadota bacterium]|nr:LysR family transcriptional regulator [Pseudomonadota bacterium]